MTINSASIQSTLLIYASKSGGLGSKSATITQQDTDTYTNGTGANQANEVFADERTLAASTAENLDLNAVLTDAFGTAIAAVKVTDIYVRIKSTSSSAQLVLGNAASNAFIGPLGATGTCTLGQNGRAHFSNPIDGWTVTAATGDILKVNNLDASNPVTYDIIILCRV